MKIVVDTNIIFSALLNSNNTIGDLLFNSEKKFEFYSCSYMRMEKCHPQQGRTREDIPRLAGRTPVRPVKKR